MYSPLWQKEGWAEPILFAIPLNATMIRSFCMLGYKNGEMADQLKNFTDSLGEAFLYPGAAMEVKWEQWLQSDTMHISKISMSDFANQEVSVLK